MNVKLLLFTGMSLVGFHSALFALEAGWAHEGSLFILTTPEGANLPAAAKEEGFPILVRLNKDCFDFTQVKPKGEDVRFFSATGKSLAYQVDEWNEVKGTASIWVRIPLITGNARQEIKMQWGKAGATSASNGAAVFNAENGHVSVLHMDAALKDEGGIVTPVDNGSTVGAGMIGDGRHFEKEKGINCGDHIKGFPFSDAAFTSEAWFRAGQAAAGAPVFSWGRQGTRFNGKTGDGNLVSIGIASPPVIQWGSDGPGGASASEPLVLEQWHHVAATYAKGKSQLYLDGQLVGTRASERATMSLMEDVCMDIGGGRQFGFAGEIDEVRISNVARSADWMRLEYENQNPRQSLVGPLVQKGSEFSVSPASVSVLEGKSLTVLAKAGGAQKLYWILKRDGVETIVGVDRFSFTLPAGRVTKDASMTLTLKAVFANETKVKDIPVIIKEDLPEPVVALKVPSLWNGRDTIEVLPAISNLDAMRAKGVAEFNYRWSVTGGAVIKEVVPGKLILKRSQYSGPITVSLELGNGGAPSLASAVITIKEPKVDAWVQRVPGKDEKPEENQFYARDDKGEGTLFYNGTQEQATDSVFLKLYADGKLVKAETQRLAADKSYAFAVKLKAGMIRYKVEFGSKVAFTEKVEKTVSNLICGDAYIIEGQSNAEACGPNNGPSEDPVTPINDWIRSYGNYMSGSTDCGWGNAVRMHIWGTRICGQHSIGAWGMVLATNLVNLYKIPVCFINGARGGTPIFLHQVNPGNRFDVSGEIFKNPYKIYGSLLTRVAAAKLTHGIRGVIWYQGENDSATGAPTGEWNYKSYQQYFIDMTAAWKTDYPNIRNYYVFQVWPLPCAMGPKDDNIREVQRSLARVFSNLRVMSTIGAASPHAGRGTCHFDLDGYALFAKYMSPLLELDNYGLVPPKAVTAPDLRSAVFTTLAKDEIALDFGQPMAWVDEAKKNFYLDGVPAPIDSGSASGNIITIKLSKATSAKEITYLKGKDWDGKPTNLIFGANGIAALTFCEVPVLAGKK